MGCACTIMNIWAWLSTAKYEGVCTDSQATTNGTLWRYTGPNEGLVGCFEGDTPLWIESNTVYVGSLHFLKFKPNPQNSHFNVPAQCSCTSSTGGGQSFFDNDTPQQPQQRENSALSFFVQYK